MENKKVHEPLFTIFKRTSFSKTKGILLRIGVVVVTFIIAMLLSSLVLKENFFGVIKTFFDGAIARPWKLALDAALLLGFGIAIVPTFKMKYWNMGANGQVLMGTMISIIVMFYMGAFARENNLNNYLTIALMFVCSVVASVIWTVIPGIFKVLFKTNETLFTLMMNYIASGLVIYVNYFLANGQKESPGIINQATHAAWLPSVVDDYFIPILLILIMTAFIVVYMSKTKHGYEVTVVGDSEKTARYVGMHTGKIIIRTLILNGIMCGIIGFLYASAINHSMNGSMCGSLGFTAVLVAWLSSFNPLIMIIVCVGLAFLTIGVNKVCSVYRVGNTELSNVIIGLMFFAILVMEFVVRYQVKFNFKHKKNKEVAE